MNQISRLMSQLNPGVLNALNPQPLPPGPPDPDAKFKYMKQGSDVMLNPQPLPPGPPDPDGIFNNRFEAVSLNPQPLPPDPPPDEVSNAWENSYILRDNASAPQWLFSRMSGFSAQFYDELFVVRAFGLHLRSLKGSTTKWLRGLVTVLDQDLASGAF